MTRPAAAPGPASRRSGSPVRLSGPGELAAALPVLLGFVPQESLVLVCLHGERVALTVRCDLPPVGGDAVLVDELRRRAALAGASSAFAVLCTDEPGPRARAGLVDRLRDFPVPPLDVLLVRAGRWRSLLCADDDCCPPDGHRLPEQAPALTLVRAEAAWRGRAVLPDRAALVTGLRPPVLPPAALEELRDVSRALSQEVVEQGRGACRSRLLEAFRRALRDGAGSAELAVALHDPVLRDEVLTWGLRREQALYALLLDLADRTAAPFDAPACASLAWVAYQRGDGAVAQVAVTRALETDPQHGLALLLQQALDAQVPPWELRAVAARSLRRPRAESP